MPDSNDREQSTTSAIEAFASSEAGRAPAARAMRAALSAMIVPAAALDAGGVVRDANRAFCALVGLTHGKLVGSNVLFLPLLDAAARRLAGALDEKQPLRLTFTHEGPDGVREFDAALGDAGPAGASVFTLQDVSHLRRAQHELRSTRDRLDALRSGSLDAFYLLRAARGDGGVIEDFVFEDVNEVGLSLLDLPRDDVVGGRLCELLPVNREEGFFERYVAVVETGLPLTEEFPIDAPEIKASWLRHQVIRHGDGVAITTRDVSEAKVREERYRRLESMEAIARVASGVSHDFQNVLTAITGYAALLESEGEEAGAEQRQAWVREIRTAAASGAEICRALLDLGATSRKSGEWVDPGAVVPEFHGVLARLLGTEHALEIDVRTGLGRVALDAGEVRRVLLNLVVNARDAMSEGGAIRVRLRTSSDRSVAETLGSDPPAAHLVLSVEDEGHGIAPQDLEHIFEPYFTTKGEQGSGLGLSLVYALVEPRGGRVEVRSDVGRGTAFHVLLPIVGDGGQLQDAGRRGGAGQPAGDGGHFLVVEDDSAVADIVLHLLRRGGHSADVARSLAEAQRCLDHSESRFDGVLVDVGLPDGDGSVFARHVHAAHPQLAIGLTSGYLGSDFPEVAAGTFEFLAKPFSPDDVVACAAALLARAR